MSRPERRRTNKTTLNVPIDTLDRLKLVFASTIKTFTPFLQHGASKLCFLVVDAAVLFFRRSRHMVHVPLEPALIEPENRQVSPANRRTQAMWIVLKLNI